MTPRQPTDPKLWAEVCNRWRATSAGTPPGHWSSLKCALSILDYERLGGRWRPGMVE